MNKINVTLLHYTPLYIASDGARTCWQSHDKSDTTRTYEDAPFGGDKPLVAPTIGPKDLELLDRVGNRFHHASILEHISMNFFIDGISRACLQELARHRMASLSVKSTRYTLKELKDETTFIGAVMPDLIASCDYTTWLHQPSTIRALKYITSVDNYMVDVMSVKALENLRLVLVEGISNDKAKYCLPEAYRTQLTWTINLRSLQNFLSLRTDKKALPEIQHLANLIYATLPDDIKLLVKHCVADEVAKEKLAEHTK